MLSWPLLRGPAPWVIEGLGIAALLLLLAVRRRRWWYLVVPVVAAGAAALTALGAVIILYVWQPFPGPLPMRVLLAAGTILAAFGLAGAGFAGRRWAGRVLSVAAALLVTVAGGQVVNLTFSQYPTLAAFLGTPMADEVPFDSVPASVPLVSATNGSPLTAVWTAPAGMPATGSVARVSIPGTVSGFQARGGWVYLPPSYLSSPRAELPVLVLLAGQPGSPKDWLTGGRLAERFNAFAAAHEGLAPVVVIPDPLGSPLRNPMCIDSRIAAAQTYLDTDVPAWVKANLQVDPDPSAWAISGLSNGGTCSIQLAVNAPTVYPTFVDISGESEPTIGSHQRTVQVAFGGDEAAFAAINPLDVLAAKTFPGTAGYFVVGDQDSTYGPQIRTVFAACQAAGMDVQLHLLPGGHSWQVWGPGLASSLPWLATRTGLTG